MSMKQQCRDAILTYVDEETQRNAALTGEHLEYVQLVLKLLRDEYALQVANGDTTYTVPSDIDTTLQNMKPW